MIIIGILNLFQTTPSMTYSIIIEVQILSKYYNVIHCYFKKY